MGEHSHKYNDYDYRKNVFVPIMDDIRIENRKKTFVGGQLAYSNRDDYSSSFTFDNISGEILANNPIMV